VRTLTLFDDFYNVALVKAELVRILSIVGIQAPHFWQRWSSHYWPRRSGRLRRAVGGRRGSLHTGAPMHSEGEKKTNLQLAKKASSTVIAVALWKDARLANRKSLRMQHHCCRYAMHIAVCASRKNECANSCRSTVHKQHASVASCASRRQTLHAMAE